jgi:CelD/BcsL family acetyltransferase involved in cellulose biosynthesis
MSDYNDIIATEDDTAVLAGLLNYALSFGNGYQRLVLSRLRLDSNCLRAAQALLPPLEMSRVFSVKGSTRYLRLSSSYEAYLKTKSRNFRKSLTRARREAEKCNLAICELEPQSFPASRLAEAFLLLNFDRWGAESYYELPFPRAFVLSILPELFSERRLRAFAIVKAERLLGLDLCMVGAHSLCTWNGGFLSGIERCSPGNLLIEAGIRHACRLGLEEYDLLRGNEPYKERWATNLRQIGWFDFQVSRQSSTERARALRRDGY